MNSVLITFLLIAGFLLISRAILNHFRRRKWKTMSSEAISLGFEPSATPGDVFLEVLKDFDEFSWTINLEPRIESALRKFDGNTTIYLIFLGRYDSDSYNKLWRIDTFVAFQDKGRKYPKFELHSKSLLQKLFGKGADRENPELSKRYSLKTTDWALSRLFRPELQEFLVRSKEPWNASAKDDWLILYRKRMSRPSEGLSVFISSAKHIFDLLDPWRRSVH